MKNHIQLAITGSKVYWSLPSSTNFLSYMEEAGKIAELYVYHGCLRSAVIQWGQNTTIKKLLGLRGSLLRIFLKGTYSPSFGIN